MAKQDFQFEAALKPDEAAEYLRSIAAGLENRRLSITVGEEAVNLDVPPSVEFRLTGKFRAGEQRIRVQFVLRDEPAVGATELNIE